MTTIQEIEAAVAKLPKHQLDRFRAWFSQFDAEAWDHQFEQDAHSGKLDQLADQALTDLAEGQCTDL